MKRAELYRVYRPADDPKRFRVYVIVSRQALLDSRFSTAICAPIFSIAEGLATQVQVGLEEGLKNSSWIMCDHLVSVPKSALTQYIGSLSAFKVSELDRALAAALNLKH